MTSQSLTSDAVAEALRTRNGAPWHRFWCALVIRDVADAAPPPRRRPSFCGRPSSGDQLRRGQQLLDLVEYRALDVPAGTLVTAQLSHSSWNLSELMPI